jgi:pimeloyl-ACP methyl ester carboxylesterase
MLGNAESFLEFDVTGEISNIKCPTLIAQGDQEPVCPVDPSAIYMRDNIKNAELEVFEGVRHCPMSEDPKKFNEILARFLKEKVTW